MGADLYIKNLDRKAQYTGFEVSKRARDLGYFRDCYNSYGLFSVMNATLELKDKESLSWWRLRDTEGLFGKNGEMTVTGAKKWREIIEPKIKAFLEAKELHINDYNPDDWEKPIRKPMKDKDEAYKQYQEWANGLIEFIDLAIKTKSRIIFSV